jgi:hypothetical protein
MPSRVRRYSVFLLLVYLMAGCGRDSATPTTPTPIVPSSPFVGAWSGRIVDDAVGAGVLHLTITEQVAASLFGSWTSTFPDAMFNDSGSLTAFLNGSSSAVFLTLSSTSSRTCPVPISPATIAANLTVTGARMTGGFTALGCTTVRSGTLELTKQ